MVIKVSTKTKAGKTIIELAKLLSTQDKSVQIIEGQKEQSPYDPKFVAMVKKSAASKKRLIVNDVNELWESL